MRAYPVTFPPEDQAKATVTVPTTNIDVLVDKYVRVRDRIADMKQQHAADLAPFNQALATLEGCLLEHMNQAGLESMRAPAGTAYKAKRVSAKVMDWEATWEFIMEHKAFDLIEHRVSKVAAQAIVDETQTPIPGVEITTEVVVNVRRASAG